MTTAELLPLIQACADDYDGTRPGISWGNDFATITHDSAGATIAFRGTDNIGGWLSDAQASPAKYRAWPVPVHAGFAETVLVGAPDILQAVSKSEPLTLTGHSRGGAMSTLFAWVARDRGYAVERIVTFGEPRSIAGPLDWPFAHIRVVHDHDPIPDIPSGLGYRHVGQLLWLADRDWLSMVWDWLCRMLGLVPDGAITDHLVASYLAAVKRMPPK